MTRVKISVCLLTIMVAVSIFSGIWVNKRCISLSEKAMAVSEAFANGDIDSAAEEAEKLEAEWEDMRIKATVLLKYDKRSEIDRIVSHTEIIAKEHSDELLPQMAELIHMLDILRKNEVPYFTSVF